jgi:hypothetical protein
MDRIRLWPACTVTRSPRPQCRRSLACAVHVAHGLAGRGPCARQARGRAHGGSRVETRARMGTTERQRIIGRRRHGATNSAGGGRSAVRRDTHRRRELSGYARGGGGALRPDGYSDSPSSKDHQGRDGGGRLWRGERR